MSSVLTCTSWNEVSSSCDQFQMINEVYLIPASQQELLELMSTGGFSADAFGMAFSGYFGIWAAGAVTGLIISQIRKLR